MKTAACICWHCGSSTFKRVNDIRVIHLEKRSGIGAVRNVALRDCKAEYIAFCDVDCVPDKNWLEELARGIERSQAIGVGGQLVERLSPRATDLWRAEHLQQTINTIEREVEFLPGCNTLYKVKELIESGGFNDECVYHHEDTELGRRLTAEGKKLVFIPTAKTNHAKYDTVYSVMRSMWGFRHDKPILSFRELVIDVFRSDLHALKLFTKDLLSGKFKLLGLDMVCYAYQIYFSYKSYRLKSTAF